MTRFYLNEQQKLNTATTFFTQALAAFNAREFEADRVLLHALDGGIAIYKELGKTDRENEFQSLKAEWITAQRGINPISFEKVTLRRGEMVNTISFKVMQRAGQLLNIDLQETNAKIEEVSQLIGQIIVAAFQNGMLTNEQIRNADTQDKKEALWQSLAADTNIAVGQKRVLLMVNRFDAVILFDDVTRQLIQ
jgi:hypothetical protein